MAREDDIKMTLRESKRPKTTVYIAVFLVIAALVGFYALYSGVDLSAITGTNLSSPSDAQKASENINTGVGDISSDLDSMSQILGES